MKLIFDTRGNDKQKEVAKKWIDCTTTAIVYGGSKASGKSYLGVSLIFGDSFIYPGTFYFIARKNLNDLRKFTIPSIHEVFNHWGITESYYRYNGQDNYFELFNGSRVYLLDAKYLPSDPLYMRFGSMQMTRGWIEEAGEFSLEAKNNLQASIGRWRNSEYSLSPKLLMTCNPANNFLYSDFYKKHKENTLELHNSFIQAFPTDNKSLDPLYYKNLEQSLSKSQKERLLFGNWEYDDDPLLLVDYDAVCDLFTNDHVPRNHFEKRISSDLAMKGRDKFIAGYWEGLTVEVAINMPYSPADVIESKLKNLKTEKGVGNSNIVADSDGLGAYLEAYIKNIKEFHGNSKAVDPVEYANLRSECGYKLAEVINNRQMHIICTDEEKDLIKDELMCLKGEHDDSNQKKRIISKGVIKSLLGRSPDFMDMLIMGMYFILKIKSKGVRRMGYKL